MMNVYKYSGYEFYTGYNEWYVAKKYNAKLLDFRYDVEKYIYVLVNGNYTFLQNNNLYFIVIV